jgi:hypothetical protein
MIVDAGAANNNPSPILEYIGNADTEIPAFFIGATEGSNIIHKVSTVEKTDVEAAWANSGTRHRSIDLTSILDSSGIQSISVCRSPLTSGYTTSKSGYMCYGDGTIDIGMEEFMMLKDLVLVILYQLMIINMHI